MIAASLRAGSAAAAVCVALAGCGDADDPVSAVTGGNPVPAPGLVVKAIDPCAIDPQIQGELLTKHVRPLLTARQREVSIFVDDCPTRVDAALTWTTGTGAEHSFDAFHKAGWQSTPPVAEEGWEHAVLGEAGGHQFRVDLGCDREPLPTELAAALDKSGVDISGCFAQARVIR